MARDEYDREDLLREATALVERIELHLPHESEPVVAGFRPNGALSVYFGAAAVWHFNPAGEVRRAYWGGRLLSARLRELIALRRERTDGESVLWRSELSPAETAALIEAAHRRLLDLAHELRHGQPQVVGAVPDADRVLARLLDWFDRHPGPPRIALRPHVDG